MNSGQFNASKILREISKFAPSRSKLNDNIKENFQNEHFSALSGQKVTILAQAGKLAVKHHICVKRRYTGTRFSSFWHQEGTVHLNIFLVICHNICHLTPFISFLTSIQVEMMNCKILFHTFRQSFLQLYKYQSIRLPGDKTQSANSYPAFSNRSCMLVWI